MMPDVNDNIEKIQKQIDLGESALYDSGADIGENGVAQTEGGLPIYDIEEEVDDEGNIISMCQSVHTQVFPMLTAL